MKVVILIGFPGSGKSTICENQFSKYYRINQDLLGSREACLNEMRLALSQGKDVIIDRTNITRQQRAYFIDVALQYGVEAVIGIQLVVSEEECVARILERTNHPTITREMPLEKKRAIVYNFSRSFEPPTLDEGFSGIVITRN